MNIRPESPDDFPPDERNVRAEARNVALNHPVFPGDTISHRTAKECERRNWIRRNDVGDWIPACLCPFTVI